MKELAIVLATAAALFAIALGLAVLDNSGISARVHEFLQLE